MLHIDVSLSKQILTLKKDHAIIHEYLVSTGANGAGELSGSGKTPRGKHIVRAKIGDQLPVNTVFVGRRPTGDIFTPELFKTHPGRDWILTRILWLSGLEVGKNRLGEVDTMRRYIYIHGTPDHIEMGVPGSKGCIRMKNHDLLALYDAIPCGTCVMIRE